MGDVVQETQVSESQIAVHWREEEYYDPPPRIVEEANANDPAIRERFAEEHYPECFVEYAEMLAWERKWDTILVTIDAYYRNGELIDHKVKADEAIEAARKDGVEVEKVLVFRRIPGEYHSESQMVDGRDFFVDELLENYKGQVVEPKSMPAEDVLFLMYTSGTTGRPKGAQHSIGGYLSYVTGTSKYYQDIHPEDTYWCFADIGWITGHSYIVYGPLSLGTTSVMYEGIPTYPDAGRPWRIAEKLGVDIFHTAPTTIRMLRKLGPDEPAKYDYHFKHMTTVGEPIEPDVWRWYHDVVGVINVAWHRLGTKELESASITVDEVAEAADVPVIDEIHGRAVEMYVSLKPGFSPTPEIEDKVAKAIESQIGKI